MGERIPEIPEDIRETVLELYGRWDGEGLRRTSAFLEMVARALLAEREASRSTIDLLVAALTRCRPVVGMNGDHQAVLDEIANIDTALAAAATRA